MRHSTFNFSEASAARSRYTRPLGGSVKRTFDIVAAFAAIVWLSPLFLICYLLVLADSGRPVLFRQRRLGFGGREFICLKFRTMSQDAESRLEQHLAANQDARREWDKDHKLANDPRVTRLGKDLRRASLDELPQLYNVLKGEMSLVGPRPIVADEVAKYQEHFGAYAMTRPGLTGLWQVSGRNGISYAERVAYDVNYVRNWSLSRDVKIIVVTVGKVFRGVGAC